MQRPRLGLWVALLLLSTAGCQTLLYELQPHRLRRLNRHPPPSMDPEFSSVDSPHQTQPVSEISSQKLRWISGRGTNNL